MTLAPALTPLGSDVARQIVHQYRLPQRMRRARRMMDREDIRHLLRSHLDETIEWDEIKERDNLDELLAGLSVLHISGLDRNEDLKELGLSLEELLAILNHSAVSRYFEAYYPYAPPILFRESSQDSEGEGYLAAFANERCAEGWEVAFRQFLVLDAAFNAPGPLEDFLAIMDSYTINDYDLTDLEKALSNEKKMRRLIDDKAGRKLLEGLQDFFEFSEELDEFLSSYERFPLTVGLVWLNYGYWYGAGGERMREVARWVIETIERVVPAEGEGRSSNQRAAHLHSIMERLTDVQGYPNLVLRKYRPPLQRWRRHVEEQRASDLL